MSQVSVFFGTRLKKCTRNESGFEKEGKAEKVSRRHVNTFTP